MTPSHRRKLAMAVQVLLPLFCINWSLMKQEVSDFPGEGFNWMSQGAKLQQNEASYISLETYFVFGNTKTCLTKGPLRLIHTGCAWYKWLRQTVALQKIRKLHISLCRNATVCCTHMHQKQYVQISLYLVYQILLSMHKVKNNYIGPYLVRQFLEAAFMNLDRLFQLKCLLNEGNFQIVSFSRISNFGKIKR